jgi:hypothetical protein
VARKDENMVSKADGGADLAGFDLDSLNCGYVVGLDINRSRGCNGSEQRGDDECGAHFDGGIWLVGGL